MVERIDRRLGQSVGYLSRLFSERIEVKLRHIYEVLALMEMAPTDFFQLAYPRRAAGGAVAGGTAAGGTVPLELIESFQRLGYRVTPTEPVLPLNPEQLDRRIRDAVRQALAEGGGEKAPAGKGGKKKPAAHPVQRRQRRKTKE